MCEEFGCLPSEAEAELDRDSDNLVPKILTMRDLARTKVAYDAATKPGTPEDALQRLAQTPMLELVQLIDFDMVDIEPEDDS